MYKLNWSMFDRIYCIHYLPYKERMWKARHTLKELGIYDLPQFQWYYTNDNKFYDKLYNIMLDKKFIFSVSKKESDDDVNIEGYIRNNRVFNLAINSYNLLMQAYELGYERILIMEDDLAFIKDKKLLGEYLDNYPMDFDIVSMEYWFRNYTDYDWVVNDGRNINDYYYELIRERLVNAGFMGLSRKGIKHVLDGMNQNFKSSDYYYPDQWTYDDWFIDRCISKVPLAVQIQEYESNHVQEMWWNYGHVKIDLKDYE